jgi:hypothetical protein
MHLNQRVVRTLSNGLCIAALLVLAGCNGTGQGQGITVPNSDASPPELTLIAAQPGTSGESVTTTGNDKTLTLTSKTGPLNLSATAKDSESGIRRVELWINKRTDTCTPPGGPCTAVGPGLLSVPTFESDSGAKNPGQSGAVESSLLFQAPDLATYIPQGGPPAGSTRTVTLQIFAVAYNQLNGKSTTKTIAAVWRE